MYLETLKNVPSVIQVYMGLNYSLKNLIQHYFGTLNLILPSIATFWESLEHSLSICLAQDIYC